MTSSADLHSFAELWRQYRNCRRNKRNTVNALAFEVDAEAKLLDELTVPELCGTCGQFIREHHGEAKVCPAPGRIDLRK